MGFFDLFKGRDINEGVAEYRGMKRAMLVDVREAGEYRGGHIEGARNLPLSGIEKAPSAIADRDMPLFVYCQGGSRSRQAAAALSRMGYTDVRDIGGIASYRGKVVR